MAFPYNETVLDHFKNPRNVGKMDNPDGKSTEGSPACGDMVTLYLRVNHDTKIIEDIKFESYGCASNIATASIITELAKGKTIHEAKKLTWKDASDALGGLPPIKVHCSVLAVEGLRGAIKNYEERHGMVENLEPTTTDTIRNRLRRVMNPMKGLDMVATDLIKNIKLEDGIIYLAIDLPETHQFSNVIKEEAREKLETLWDINEIIIEFTE